MIHFFWFDKWGHYKYYGLPTNEAIYSQLPGRENGPADAHRHICRSALLTSEHPLLGPVILNANEFPSYWDRFLNYLFNYSLDSKGTAVDYHNNEIGKKLGIYSRENNLNYLETFKLAREVMEKSFGDFDINKDSLIKIETDNGPKFVTSLEPIQLSNGLTVNRAAVLNPEKWKKNPEILKNGQKVKATIQESNWPKQGWLDNFVYQGLKRDK